MRYSDSSHVNGAYELIGTLYEVQYEDPTNPERAMTIAAALVDLGEDRSWASVFWAYGAAHHDLSDEACERALELLTRVDASDEARAAALLLRAEIEFTQAVQREADPDPRRQLELLAEATRLAPHWPSLRVRSARASLALGLDDVAHDHAEAAVDLLARAAPSHDPFDSAITGMGLSPGWVTEELGALGLLGR